MRSFGQPPPVDGERASITVGILTSLVVIVLDLSPTGSVGTDAVVIALGVTVAVWGGSHAPWWAAVAFGTASIAVAGAWWALAAGLVGVIGGVAASLRPDLRRPVMAVAVGAGIVAWSGARELGAFGLSSLVAIMAALTVALLGMMSMPPNLRRTAGIGAAVFGVASLFAAAGLAVAAANARSDLEGGSAAAERGLELVRSGEFDLAGGQFAAAAGNFRRAELRLRRPWAQPARLVPVLAQHRVAGEEMANAAAAASRLLDIELESLDLAALTVVDGRIDVGAVEDLRDPLERVNRAVDRLASIVDAQQSNWLLPPVRQALDELSADLDEQRSLGAKAADALAVAPAMLGADDARRYLIMFTTPAEARGHGGFMGNYAELTFDNGRISLTQFGRHDELTQAGRGSRRLVDAPNDWLERYGTFGFTTGPDGTTGTAPWANITMSPHFPSTAAVVAELYPQSGGRSIDGVFSLDVFALQEIVGLVGPIELAGVPTALDGSNTANFLLVGQYAIDDTESRVDLLESVARTTLARLLGGSAPDPLDLGRALAPMVRERRVAAWSRVPNEEAMLAQTGLDGALLTDLDGTEGIAVTVDNASGNKIDTFLEREFELTAVAEPPGAYELTIRLHNDPPLGLPDYVVGNLVNLPRGTSRLFVSVHSTMPMLSASDPGGPLGLHPSVEAGHPVYSAYVDVPAGGSIEWRLLLETAIPRRPVTTVDQPLVIAASWSGSATVDENVTDAAD